MKVTLFRTLVVVALAALLLGATAIPALAQIGPGDSPVPTPPPPTATPSPPPEPPPTPEPPAPPDEPFPPEAGTDLRIFLALVASGGLGWLIGGALAYVLEEIPAFRKLSREAKRAISIAGSVALPMLALFLLQTLPAEFFDLVNPYWATLVTALSGVFGNKKEYRSVIKPQRKPQPKSKPQPGAAAPGQA